MFCTNCGAEVSDQAVFCNKCGYQFGDAEDPEPEVPEAKAAPKKKDSPVKVTGNYEYTVVPFIGQISDRGNAEEVSRQLRSLIQQHANHGWELVQVVDVNIEIRPGCLGRLFGREEAYIRFDQVIFKRPA